MSNKNKRIALNTLFLYFRIFLIILISLYTSRVILEVLGVDDFGIFQSVGGVVVLLSFINSALSSASSRFLMYELGKGNNNKLKSTFGTLITVHTILAVIIVIFAETFGLWMLNNKLVISPDKLFAAHWVFQLSVLTAIINITQVPYTSVIIAHERLKVYAYIGVVEVVFKLLIVYLLMFATDDKLIKYSIYLFVTQLLIAMFYRYYCRRNFDETKFKFGVDKSIFKSVFSFSGWSLFANAAIALNEHGTTIITNMFFGPSIVAARAISIQVNMAANQLVNNFRVAVNPQIVKSLAEGDAANSKKILLFSTKLSYYLMLVLALPIYFGIDFILEIWLVDVPNFTNEFIKLILIQSLFSVFDTCFYAALFADGKLRENALLSPVIGFIRFPIVYILFKTGSSPLVLSYAGIVTYILLGMIVKPYLLIKIVAYRVCEIVEVFITCFKVTLFSLPCPILWSCYNVENLLVHNLLLIIISFISVLSSVYFFGIDAETRSLFILKIKYVLHK